MYKLKYLVKLQVFLVLMTCVSISEISTEECKVAKQGFAVVELFTSEGCSDCPPADKNLIEISKFDSSKNVYALAFHVTYWDYIGWKDPFGKQEFTDRQEKYSSLLRTGNYTPQAVVNGKIDVVGSRRTSLFSSIESELANPTTTTIELNPVRKGNTLEIQYKISCTNPNQFLNIALVEKGISSIVTRGENRGSTLKHENVVRLFQSLTLNKNSGTIKLEFSGLEKNHKNFELISYLQDNKTFAITGAISRKID